MVARAGITAEEHDHDDFDSIAVTPSPPSARRDALTCP